MKTLKVSKQTFDEIKLFGHGVPRTNARYIDERFKVSKEYLIEHESETLKVRCTQNCPVHLRVIE